MPLFALFFTFFLIGAVTFGGGYAMLPLFQHKLVDETALISPADFSNMTALSQLTPGAIGLNMATFIGYNQHGFAGALVGTLGLLAPAMVITATAAFCLEKFRRSKLLPAALSAINPAVFGLIVSALIFFLTHSVLRADVINRISEQFARHENWRSSFVSVCDYRGLIIFLVALVISAKTRISAPVVLVLSALAGVLLYW